MFKKMTLTLLAIAGVSFGFAQRGYDYPSALTCADGRTVKTAAQWEQTRRGEIEALFAREIYGVLPDVNVRTSYEELSVDRAALGGRATRKEVRVTFAANGMERTMDILLYLPNARPEKVPVFVGLNFNGNYATTNDPVSMPRGWVPNRPLYPIADNKPNENGRGQAIGRWPMEQIIARGYAVATVYCGDLHPDHADGYEESVCKMLYTGSGIPDSIRCKAIGAWAWGLSRTLDYLEREPAIDASRAAVVGHSRLGKAALWAGAQDRRFALVISNESGCGGAAPFRYKIGESLERVDRAFPHWFAGSFRKYGNRESSLPVDQNNLLALVAPRALYVASAVEDVWADPEGEFFSARLAGEVYDLYGKKRIPDTEKQPPVNTPLIAGSVGYHVREGKHDINLYDWTQFMNFAGQVLK